MPGDTAWAVFPNTVDEWCSGFWPGILWYDYALTRDADVQRAAWGWTRAIRNYAFQPVYDHDLGMMMMASWANALRFSSPSSPQSSDCPKVLLSAADSLSTLFNPTVGTLLSWPRHVIDYHGHNTVISSLVNLELLLLANELTGDSTYMDIALRHADTTMVNQFRTDGSCYRVSVYDPHTGYHLYNCTQAGATDESVWARGQSWAIYGYTSLYRYTRRQRYLDFARKLTDVYLQQLPSDMVPYWDFNRTDFRDASSAAVVASALLDLATFVQGETSDRYHRAALQMLASLSQPPYISGPTNAAFLLHSVGNYKTDTDVDASIVTTDYYYIEALYKLKQLSR